MSLAVIGIRPVNMVGTIFLARLLEPQDFGLVALATLAFTIMRPFAGVGMSPAVVQSKLDRESIAFPAFLVTLITCTVLSVVFFLNAGFIAGLLGDPAVEPIVRVLSVVFLLDAGLFVPGALLQKSLRFGPLSVGNFSSQLIELGVSLTLAFLGFGVWSLVCGRLANALTTLAVYWIADRNWVWLKPGHWQWQDLRSLLSFGIRSTGSQLANLFNENWDSLLVGRVLGATSLGYYSKAFKLTSKTMEGISQNVVDTVSLPTFAGIQDEQQRLARIFVKTMNLVALIAIPLSLGTFVAARELVGVLLGAKWLPMVPVLQVFAIKTVFRPLSRATGSLFQGVGRPEYNLRAGLVYASILVPLSLWWLKWDIAGVAAAVLVGHALAWLYNLWQVTRVLPGVLRRLLAAMLPGLGAGGLMMLAVQLSKQPLLRLVHGQHNLLSVGIMVGLGAAIYLLVAFLLQRTLFLEVLQMFLGVLRGERRARRRAARKEPV